jgi:hypothetical protein
VSFLFSHAYCDPYTLVINDSRGSEITIASEILTDDTMTFTFTPKVYEDWGLYTMTIEFSAPLTQTFDALFTADVIDPCLADLVSFTAIVSPDIAPYSIGDTSVTYSFTWTDTVSLHFEVDSTCGLKTLQSSVDRDSTLSDMAEILTVSEQKDSVGFDFDIFNDNYWFIDTDKTLTVNLEFIWDKYSTTEYL